MVRQWRPYRAGGDSATPTGARPARRQRPMSARRIRRLATRSAIRAASRIGAWPRRSASSSTAWTVEATIRSGDVPPRTQPREGEVAEPAMLTA